MIRAVSLGAVAGFVILAGAAQAAGLKDKVTKYGGCWNDPKTVESIRRYPEDPNASLDDVIAMVRTGIPRMAAHQQRAEAQGSAAAPRLAEYVGKMKQLLATMEQCKASTQESVTRYCRALRVSPAGPVPSRIDPGDRVVITLAAPDEGRVAVIEIAAGISEAGVVVRGQIRNVGETCALGTHQPVRLHPVANGLPIGWHSVPHGMQANPTLQPGQHAPFEKRYSSDYKGGFNLALGTLQPQ